MTQIIRTHFPHTFSNKLTSVLEQLVAQKTRLKVSVLVLVASLLFKESKGCCRITYYWNTNFLDQTYAFNIVHCVYPCSGKNHA